MKITKEAVPLNSFKRDLKLADKRGFDLSEIDRIIDLIIDGDDLEPRHKKHKLYHNYRGCWECHIKPDLLLIWYEDQDTIYLRRLGSHSELFDKVRKR
ncbi:MAG: type II toxin-antitoxin system YafQ family toxin [Candidatus Pacebacteria bacterium]|nr:type II toxin-antitoxin system YafQ family toxin [Candidatus Paceibacterota bacterium]